MSAISSSDLLAGRRATSRTTIGTRMQAGELGGAPAALAGDDLKAIADSADDDRLDDAVGIGSIARAPARRASSTVARGWKSFGASRSMSTSTAAVRGVGRVGNQRAETFAKRGSFFHGSDALMRQLIRR